MYSAQGGGQCPLQMAQHTCILGMQRRGAAAHAYVHVPNRCFKHTLSFILKIHNSGNQARSEGKCLSGVRGNQRLPSTKDKPSWWELESLKEEPGRTYTFVPERSRAVAEELCPREEWSRMTGRAFPLSYQCSSRGHRGMSDPVSPTKASGQHSDGGSGFHDVHQCSF